MSNNMVIILVGAPGSGKSTWGKHHADTRGFIRLCPDDFRAILGSGEDDQSVSKQAFASVRSGMDNALAAGKSVLIDATNMYKKTRKQFLDISRKYKVPTLAVVFEVSKETLLERNQKRGVSGGRNVPEHVIDSMLGKYERPNKSEFDEIQFITKINVCQF